MNNSEFVSRLFKTHDHFACNLPSRHRAQEFIEELLSILFPHFLNQKYTNEADIADHLTELRDDLIALLRPMESLPGTHSPADVATTFFEQLPGIYDMMLNDADAIHRGDPAAISVDEVILTYPGFFAIAIYRISHALCSLGVRLLPRVFTEFVHEKTGIDIHPGAQIGQSFCIDHGTGIVIGETTKIGDNVKVYQGVTLGALSVDKNFARTKRHPTIEDNVVIYANATILGGDTIIGHDSIIGGNVWITESVPPHTRVYHQAQTRVHSAQHISDPGITGA
jgi:serine O-acetyltransferase